MKVDGNKPGDFLYESGQIVRRVQQEPLRLKYAAQILAGLWASGHPRVVEQTAEVLGKTALNGADELIARHNKDQQEEEKEKDQ